MLPRVNVRNPIDQCRLLRANGPMPKFNVAPNGRLADDWSGPGWATNSACTTKPSSTLQLAFVGRSSLPSMPDPLLTATRCGGLRGDLSLLGPLAFPGAPGSLGWEPPLPLCRSNEPRVRQSTQERGLVASHPQRRPLQPGGTNLACRPTRHHCHSPATRLNLQRQRSKPCRRLDHHLTTAPLRSLSMAHRATHLLLRAMRVSSEPLG